MGGVFGHGEPRGKDVLVWWGSERLRRMEPTRLHRGLPRDELKKVWRDVLEIRHGQYDIIWQPMIAKSIRKVVHVDVMLKGGHRVFLGRS